jgi:D-glycero-alpha-D-manno-heptose-7-phosphate kinase
MKSVVVRAPTRLDFGGGWTDVPPYATQEGGRVCNIAIDRYAEVRLDAISGPAGSDLTISADSTLARAATRRAGVTGVRSTIRSDFPTGAGLGGSSAVGIALAAALHTWKGLPIGDRGSLVEESREVEVLDVGIAGGWQDHYAAAFGGALDLTFGAANSVRCLPLPDAVRAEIERRCLVFYTGQSRISGDTITAVLDAYAAREPRVLDALDGMKRLAGEMSDALETGDIDTLGRLLGTHWELQRSLHPSIPTPRIDQVLHDARAAGALGGKALGASGGGCVVVVARTGTEDAIRAAVGPFAQPLEFSVDTDGVRILTIDGVIHDGP